MLWQTSKLLLGFGYSMRNTILAGSCIAALLATLPEAALAADWKPLGLIRTRDMTPFGLPRLDFLPAHAIPSPAGSFGAELTLTYQNTWALSNNVEDYLRSRGSERSALTSTDIDAILALPGDAYLVDGEYGLADLTLEYQVSSRWGVYATLPYYFFDGGFIDSTIEGFHETFGFSNAGRNRIPRNEWNVITKFGTNVAVSQQAPDNEFGDPVVGVRYALKERPDDWNFIFEAAAKIPRDDASFAVSTGEADYGVQVSFQKFFTRNALYASFSGVYYDAPEPVLTTEDFIPTIVLGWETRMTQNTNFILQLYGSRSVIQETNLDELSRDKVQLTVGIQRLYRGNSLRFGFTENLSSFNNTPDVGFTFSIAHVFGID